MARKIPIRFPAGARARLALRRLLAAAAALGFLLAAAWILRLAWADLEFRRGTPSSAQRAAALAPGHAPYWMARSDWGSPDGEADLERAVRLNPYYSEAWIELGLAAEARGDLARAERCLEQAARVDKGFRPRWSLANYYFRRRRPDEFWKWARLSLLVAPGDATALYRLCWLFEPNEELILTRAIPDEPDHLARYLLFLLEQRRPEAAVRVAHRLIEQSARAHAGLLVGLTEQLLTRGDVGRALAVWNAMCERGVLPYEPLDAHRGPLVTNADFRLPPRGAGFDWRILPVEGVSAAVAPAGGGLRLRFSGRQPDRCELLVQYLPVRPRGCYTLRWRYRSADLAEESGLRWQISEPSSRRRLAAGPPRWDRGDGAAALDFCTGPAAELIQLTLRYDRLAGTTPLQGSLLLEGVELSAAARAAVPLP